MATIEQQVQDRLSKALPGACRAVHMALTVQEDLSYTGVVLWKREDDGVVWGREFGTHAFRWENGEVSFFWGHYDLPFDRAASDFIERRGN